MNRRNFMAKAAALPISVSALVTTGFAATATDQQQAVSKSASGQPVMDRYRLTLNRVLHGSGPSYTPELLIADIRATPGRRFTNFSGDVSGRWIGALSTASEVYGEQFPDLDAFVRQVVALQHKEGYFGAIYHFDAPDDEDMALLWGNGRLLIGLMEYYNLTKQQYVLTSAKQLGDFLVRLGPKFNSAEMSSAFDAAHFATSYICWTQQTEGLAALYAATQDKRYLDLTAEISKRIERRPGDHVHGYLCSLRGALDLYNITGDSGLRHLVEAGWNDVMSSGDVLITSGVPEAWSPKKLRTEGCAECDWLRFNLSLWKTTGDPKYLDMAESVIFNELAMNQFATGDFGHAVLNESGTPETVMVRAWWCCTFHGLRSFPDIHRSVFRANHDEVFYDLPLDGQLRSDTFSAHAESRLATDGTVTIYIAKASPKHTLKLRQPAWASGLTIEQNGRLVAAAKSLHLKAGDRITAKYAMKLSQFPAGGGTLLAGKSAFRFGPWLLGASSETNHSYFNELEASDVVFSTHAPSKSPDADSPFRIPIAALSASYRPAEFPEQPAMVELRAIAEQTASRTARWQTAFIVKVDS